MRIFTYELCGCGLRYQIWFAGIFFVAAGCGTHSASCFCPPPPPPKHVGDRLPPFSTDVNATLVSLLCNVYKFHIILTVDSDCFLISINHLILLLEKPCFPCGIDWIFKSYLDELVSLPLPSPLPNAKPFLQPILTRTTSGHCLGNFVAENLFAPPLSPDKCAYSKLRYMKQSH